VPLTISTLNANKIKADDQKIANDKELSDLDTLKKTEIAKLKQQGLEKGLTEDEINGTLLNKELDFLFQKLWIQEKNNGDILAAEADIEAKKAEIADNALKVAGATEQQRAELKKKYLDDNLTNEQQKAAALLELDNIYNTESLRQTEEYQQLKKAITEKYEKDKFEIVEKYLQAADQLMSVLMDMSNARKAKELKAAGDNAAKREAIEKKYAKSQQKIQIGQALIAGAMAILQIWKGTTTGEPISDTIIKGILSALVGIKTGAEIATIKNAQFDVGGYTGGTQKYKPAGIVHEGEFVNNQEAVKNPHVRKFLDIFDYYQRTGQISKLNTATILANVPMQQKYTGGFVSSPSSASLAAPVTIVQQSDPALIAVMQRMIESADRLAAKPLAINTREIFKSEEGYQNAVKSSEY
jgi:hypothetical protein